MTLGLIQYVLGARFLGTAGLTSCGSDRDRAIFKKVLTGAVATILIIAAMSLSGSVVITAEQFSTVFGFVLLGIVVALFGFLLTTKSYTPIERRRFGAILVLFIAAALFWSAFEQAGSTLNLFAERNTNLHRWDAPVVGLFRASYFQALNSIFIIALAPVFAWLWVKLGRRNPGSTAKFSWGLLFVGLGFAILIPVSNSTLVSPWWLTLTYLLHTIGELCLSPVGLSAMTKLAPVRATGMIMGVWFLADGVGNFIGGRLASVYETFPLPELFGVVAGFCFALALVLVFLIRPMKHLSEGVK
jgi:POT family proton-dependent oligopeptide transporter